IALAELFLPIEASAQKTTQTAVYTPPGLRLTSDTSVGHGCAEGVAQVRLNARASSPGGNPIRYRWSTSAGRITGDGSAVVWVLTGLVWGVYRAFFGV